MSARRFTAANMAQHSYTDSEAASMARRFHVIAANRHQFRNHTTVMRNTNPTVSLLVYFNGTFAQKSQGSTFPAGWYLRDRDGQKVTSAVYGNFLMDPTHPEWVSSRQTEALAALADSGYDGCFIDMLGTAPLDPGYLTALPVNPASGEVWTRNEWLTATAHIAAAVKAAVGSRPVVGNGLGNGDRYFSPTAPTSVLLDRIDGGLAEAWLRTAAAPADRFKAERSWRKDVDLLADAGSKAFVMTKAFTGTTSQKDRWHRYTLASFLLGTHGGALSFLRENTPWTSHLWDFTDIGEPAGPYTKTNVYQRLFARGAAYVNPTVSTVTVRLGRQARTLDGRTVTTLTLPANTGDVVTYL